MICNQDFKADWLTVLFFLGFNVIYDLLFSDNVVWIARIPLPYHCFQAESVSTSYAATLNYLKRHSTIPVPTVFAYCLHSNPDNKVNATYILMEQLSGHPLPVLEQKDFDPDSKDLALAKKVHQQLTDVILQLGKFISHLVIILVLRTYFNIVLMCSILEI